MEYLVDADWLISFLRGRREAIALFDRLRASGIAVSVIAWGEVYEGTLGNLNQVRELEELSNSIDILPVGMDVARRYARIRSHLRAMGLLIPDNDLWIASTALAHGLTIVS